MARFAFITLIAAALLPMGILGAAVEQTAIMSPPVHTADKWDWEPCGDPETDLVQIRSIKVSPDPPKPGENLTVTVSGHVNELIEEGAYADVLVKLGVIKLLQRQFDICEEAENADAEVKCPVKEGDYDVSQTVALPKEIPKAKFVVMIDAFTKDDVALTCVKITVDFMMRFPRIW